jgi:endonuclease/exonuclease/phosphatase family metal-dependent hydrolase
MTFAKALGRRPFALVAFLATLASSSLVRAESPIRLRVLTWNVWGVPAITSHLDERMAALPSALGGLDPDIVLLQELWEPRHAESVGRKLGERGLRHFRRFDTPAGATGLFVASKFPLGAGAFRSFSLGRMPHSFWHLDWMVEKGVANVVVETPLGALRVENTHLQAQYRTDRYGPERLAQAAEIVLMNGGHANETLLLAGDFNGPGDELPRRVLRDLGSLEDASPSSHQDSVYARGSRALSIRIVSARPALGEPYRLGNGVMEPLSDHAALLVELELSRCTDCSRDRRVVSATRAGALASLERAADMTPFRVVLALLTTLAVVVIGMAWKRRLDRFTEGPPWRVALRIAGFTALVAGFVWSSYLGFFYYPTRAQTLRQIASALEAMPEK